ncbi:MAG: prepilin-type N-terminal cleavage/methylation domain-containing protein [Clostridiales bacterium]|nr:prepilin-type N-terminal cleavage/methylation domain-containing protein [Clostridiales bacterium]
MPKKSGGFTLIELIIAVAVLMIVLTAMFGMFFYATRLSVRSHYITLASFEAQLQIEQLVGRDFGEVWHFLENSEDGPWGLEYSPTWVIGPFPRAPFDVRLVASSEYEVEIEDDDGNTIPDIILMHIRIHIYLGDNEILRQEHIINIARGGISAGEIFEPEEASPGNYRINPDPPTLPDPSGPPAAGSSVNIHVRVYRGDDAPPDAVFAAEWTLDGIMQEREYFIIGNNGFQDLRYRIDSFDPDIHNGDWGLDISIVR